MKRVDENVASGAHVTDYFFQMLYAAGWQMDEIGTFFRRAGFDRLLRSHSLALQKNHAEMISAVTVTKKGV